MEQKQWPVPRRAPRAPLGVPVRIAVLVTDFDAFTIRIAMSRDISELGMYLEDQTPSAIGAQLELMFDLPSLQHDFVLQATVRRIVLAGSSEKEHPGMGVEFMAPKPEQVALLKRYVDMCSQAGEPAQSGVAGSTGT